MTAIHGDDDDDDDDDVNISEIDLLEHLAHISRSIVYLTY
jgi:hypothetical protein